MRVGIFPSKSVIKDLNFARVSFKPSGLLNNEVRALLLHCDELLITLHKWIFK